jgi:ankyrin repeat protein
MVRLLLGRGDIDANSKDYDRRTPLLVAAEGGHEAVVRLLPERGDVNTNPKDCNRWTPLTSG